MFEEDVFQSKMRKRSHAAAALVCRVLLFSCIGVRESERLKSMPDMLSRSCRGPLSGDVYPHGFPPEVFSPYFIDIKMSTSGLSSYRDVSVFKSTALLMTD